jgi:hypothetical protein
MKVPDVAFPLGTHPSVFEFSSWVTAILNNGRYQLRVIETPPDWTTNDGEMLCVDNNGQKSLYVFVTDEWFSVGLTSTASGSAGVPTGAILPFAGPTTAIPSGWALCNGAAVSRTTYSQLYSVIGTAYGVGDGSTTFNLPNLCGYFPLGAGKAYTGGGGHTTIQGETGEGLSVDWDGSKVWNDSGSNEKAGGGGTCTGQHRDMMPPYVTVYYIVKL